MFSISLISVQANLKTRMAYLYADRIKRKKKQEYNEGRMWRCRKEVLKTEIYEENIC